MGDFDDGYEFGGLGVIDAGEPVEAVDLDEALELLVGRRDAALRAAGYGSGFSSVWEG